MINSVKVTDTSFLGQLMKNDPGAFARVKIGEVVAGTVLKKGSNILLVDLGAQGTGIVYRGELQNARELVRGLEKGDRIHGKVVDPDNEEGFKEKRYCVGNTFYCKTHRMKFKNPKHEIRISKQIQNEKPKILKP